MGACGQSHRPRVRFSSLIPHQVDPEETDMWGGFRKISQKILDFGQVKYVSE